MSGRDCALGGHCVLVLLSCMAVLVLAPQAARAEDKEQSSFSVPAQEILASPKILLAPTSVLQEFAPGGYEPADQYLASSAEVWQAEIAQRDGVTSNMSS